MNDISVFQLFLDAGIVVKLVVLVLLSASLTSWIIIIERYRFYKKIRKMNKDFLKDFWTSKNLNTIYDQVLKSSEDSYGAINVFKYAFKEYQSLEISSILESDLEGINRSMRVAISSDDEEMNKNLSYLANVGSVSPYIGLFGTVWGIMTAFQGLSDATQATINAVAPGISEALVATALGLFAAIPAVIAFNRFTSEIDSISQSTVIFAEELASIFYKQTYKNNN